VEASGLINAAGGVLWREGQDGPVVALVHRPRYDDWSLPKGKLHPGEHVLLGAIREVAEETGHRGPLGRPLGRQHYIRELPSGPVPKVVDFWAVRATDGNFAPNSEVDAIEWVPVATAQAAVTLERDRATLRHFESGPASTVPLILLRHATAGQRGRWPGRDDDRPLDSVGRRDADALAALLACYRPRRVHSAEVVRCVETVRPFAEAAALPVEVVSAFGERSYARSPEGSVKKLFDVLDHGEPTLICSQGKVIPGLIQAVCERYQIPGPADPDIEKGAFWVLHTADGSLAAVEQHRP
jgi:8-oxo-dGTP diphosphatase